MHVETFTVRMKTVDYHLRDERFADALSSARQLRRDLMSEVVVETDQVCWPLYYELRTLYALKRWRDLTIMMHRYYTLLLAMGPKDNGYAHTLAMEAALHTDSFDDFTHWARQCFEFRIIDQDLEALQSTLQTAKSLLDSVKRLDLFPQLLDNLTEVAMDHEETELADLSREWAEQSREHLRQYAQ